MNRRLTIILVILLIIIYIGYDYSLKENNKKMWSEDFDYIISEIERLHPNPYRVVSKEDFKMNFNDLLNRCNELSDEQVIFELATIITDMKDGHTSLMWSEYLSDDFYPVRFKIINNNLYVIDAIQEYEDLKYQKVVNINGINVNEVIERISNYCSAENEYFEEFLTESMLTRFDYYKYSGLLSNSNDLELNVKNEDGGIFSNYTIPVVSKEKVDDLRKNFKWSSKHRGVLNYNYEYDSKNKVIILNYNKCYEDDSLSVEDFNKELWSFIESHDVEKMIIDLSLNLGGNSKYFKIFFDNISRSDLNREGGLFVIIDNQNYSAGTNAAAILKRFTSAKLIGEPTGGSPRMFGNRAQINTPNKNVKIGVAITSFDDYPGYNHNAIMPDVLIVKSIDDFRFERNPYFEYVIKH